MVTVGTMALATLPTPLYPAYARAFHLDTTGITVLFAVFATGAIGGLSVTRSRISTRWPVRSRIIAAALLGVIAAVLLALVPGVAAFALGRLLSGVGVGVAAASAVTFVTESARASGRHVRLWTVLTPGLAMTGLALGPATAGLLVGTGALPRWGLYIAVAGVLGLSAAMLPAHDDSAGAGAPTSEEARGHPACTAPHSTSPRPARWPHRLGACTAFAVTGLFGALTPHLLSDGHRTPTVTEVGVLAALPFIAGAFGATALSARVQWALPLLITGLVLVTASTVTVSGSAVGTPLFAGGALAAGAGAGSVFSWSLRSSLRAATLDRRADAATDAFVWAYLGLAVPVVAVGTLIGVVQTAAVLGGITVLVSVAGAALVWRGGLVSSQ